MDRILITGQELSNIILEALLESMSIADEVSEFTYNLHRAINADIKKKEANKEVFEGSFRIMLIDGTYTVEWTLYDITKGAKPQVGASIDFKNKIVKVDVVKTEDGIDSCALADSLQHELEHLYQKVKRPDEEIFNDNDSVLYNKTLELLNTSNPNSALYGIARCVYLMFNAEQDAYANGLYGALVNGDTSPRGLYNTYIRSDAYKQLSFLADFSTLFKDDEFINSDNFKKASDIFNRDLDWFIKHTDKAIRRFSRKIGRVRKKATSETSNKRIEETYQRVIEGKRKL